MGAYEVLVAQNVALKFGNDRQHACEGAVTWRREVEGFAQRDEPDFQRGQLPARWR